MPLTIVPKDKARERLGGICNTTLHELIKAGRLPKPIRISANRTGFLESDLDAYIERCVKESRGEQFAQIAV